MVLICSPRISLDMLLTNMLLSLLERMLMIESLSKQWRVLECQSGDIIRDAFSSVNRDVIQRDRMRD